MKTTNFSKILLILLFKLLDLNLNAQNVNWAENIAPILYQNCTSCHNPNGIAPFSLLSYSDAYNSRFGIQAAVASGAMPPWPPDPAYRKFAHQKVLTQTQINAIVNWVNDNAPEGNPSLAPEPPVYSSGSTILNPDTILKMPDFVVNSMGANDLYRCFVMPTNVPAGTYIKEIEIIPGNRNIVHHVLVFQDNTNVPIELDAADPAPGYQSFGFTGSLASKLIYAYVPGAEKYILPEGMGIRLDENTNIIFQMHYPAGVNNQLDSTKIVLKFDYSPQRNVILDDVISYLNPGNLSNGPLIIPPDSIKKFYAQVTIPTNATILGISPHMHLIGKSSKCFGVTPQNDTIPLISIPQWDFNWQTMYRFPQLIKIPQGTVIYSVTEYDNTSSNPYNPSNPPITVTAGENTTQEMLMYFFAFTSYQPGDENIIIDSTVLTSNKKEIYQNELLKSVQLYDLYPSPTNDIVNFDYYAPNQLPITAQLLSVDGRVLEKKVLDSQISGFQKSSFNVHHLSGGTYFVQLINDGTTRTKKFIKN